MRNHKRQIGFVVCFVVFVLILSQCSKMNTLVKSEVILTTVQLRDFQASLYVKGKIVAPIVRHALPSEPVQFLVEYGNTVKKGDALAQYTTLQEETKYVRSSIDGVVMSEPYGYDIQVANISNYKVEVSIPTSMNFDLKSAGRVTLFYEQQELELALQSISTIVETTASDNYILAYYSFSVKPENLKLYGQGNVRIDEALISHVLTVENEAVLFDQYGAFMVDGKWMEQLQRPYTDFRIDIKVLNSNQQYSMIEGVGLEEKTVCIIPQYIKDTYATTD